MIFPTESQSPKLRSVAMTRYIRLIGALLLRPVILNGEPGFHSQLLLHGLIDFLPCLKFGLGKHRSGFACCYPSTFSGGPKAKKA